MDKELKQKVAIVLVEGLFSSPNVYRAPAHEYDKYTSIIGKKCVGVKNYAVLNPSVLAYTISTSKYSYIEDDGCVWAITIVVADGNLVFRYLTDKNGEHQILDFVEEEDWITDLHIINAIEN